MDCSQSSIFYVLDHQDRELNGTGGYLGSITVPRPLSRFDTHPQAKLETFDTKMAAITQSARFQRSYGKNGELSIVQLPMPIPTSFLVSGAAAQKFCLECRTHSLNGKQCINTQNIYSARCIFFCEEWQISRRVLSTSAFGLMEDNILLNQFFFFHIILSLPHSFVLKHSSDWFSALVESLLLYLKVSVINWLFNCIY